MERAQRLDVQPALTPPALRNADEVRDSAERRVDSDARRADVRLAVVRKPFPVRQDDLARNRAMRHFHGDAITKSRPSYSGGTYPCCEPCTHLMDLLQPGMLFHSFARPIGGHV